MTLSSSILLGIGLACSVALLFKDLWVIEPYMVSFVCFLLLAVCNLKIGWNFSHSSSTRILQGTVRPLEPKNNNIPWFICDILALSFPPLNYPECFNLFPCFPSFNELPLLPVHPLSRQWMSNSGKYQFKFS